MRSTELSKAQLYDIDYGTYDAEISPLLFACQFVASWPMLCFSPDKYSYDTHAAILFVIMLAIEGLLRGSLL